jgi:hypothetical protein
VRRQLTLGHFAFGRLAMYADLEPQKWQQHPVLHGLVGSVLGIHRPPLRRRRITQLTIPRSQRSHRTLFMTQTLPSTAHSSTSCKGETWSSKAPRNRQVANHHQCDRQHHRQREDGIVSRRKAGEVSEKPSFFHTRDLETSFCPGLLGKLTAEKSQDELVPGLGYLKARRARPKPSLFKKLHSGLPASQQNVVDASLIGLL